MQPRNPHDETEGLRYLAAGYLEKCKAEAGLADRADIQAVGQLFDVEEGRKK